ncbi:hypothetical protein EK21DRAFT_86632 [Setomelanomma holmii]|uniref:Uncharacterized protein n=1 Tax=Setomelanomma holmii TaxID=210430 RepID=A0A9P4LPI8_9PLEO|nr:hypothetical protein EK21DRAFT_86632 [Setomelanomma holmii]
MMQINESQWNKAVLLEAQTRCREFAATFLTTLPVELREMVYEQAWDDDERYEPHTPEGSDDLDIYFRDSERVLPADHLRHLEIELEPCEETELRTDDTGNFDDESRQRFKTRANLVLEWAEVNVVEKNLKTLRQVLCPLRAAGACVEVYMLAYARRSYDGSELQDVSDYYDMPLAEWQAKWSSIVEEEREHQADDVGHYSDTNIEVHFLGSDADETDSSSSKDEDTDAKSQEQSISGSEDSGTEEDDAHSGAKPAEDPVIHKLAARASGNPELKEVMSVVAADEASKEQLQMFQDHIDELKAEDDVQ